MLWVSATDSPCLHPASLSSEWRSWKRVSKDSVTNRGEKKLWGKQKVYSTVFRWLWSEKRTTGQPEASITIVTPQPEAACPPPSTEDNEKDSNTGLSPQNHAHGVSAHSVTAWAGKQTNTYSWLGCISLHTAVPGCLNSPNGAIINRYLLVTLLDLFHSLEWQTAWTGLVLLTASLPSLHYSHLFLLTPIFPKPSILLIMMMAGVQGS